MKAPRKSLTVNAAALMTATIATNGLGLVFWTFSARLAPAAVVGHAAATIAALTLLASISQLNLTNVFMRLLPAAGRLTKPLIERGYLAVIALSIGLAAIYVGSGLSAHVVTGGLEASVLFAATVPVLSIFALQDSVLTALRLTPWVPVENISFGASKIALLPLLLVASVGGGIVVSWVVPAALCVIVVNWLLFRRALPALAGTEGTLPKRRRLLSFVAGEYVGNICAIATVQLMPLLILWQLGAVQAAYFALPWLILMAITFLLWNVSSSLVVELAGGHEESATAMRRSLLLWTGVALGTMTVCIVGADPLLHLAGERYAAHGASLLRLIGLSMPFTAVVALYRTLTWIDQRVWLLAALQAAAGAAVIGLALLLLPQLGIAAAGWANLATQAVSAAVMGPLAWRRLRRQSPGVMRWAEPAPS